MSRRSQFEQARVDIQQRCGSAMRDARNLMADELGAFAAEADAHNYSNPEVGFLSIKRRSWEALALALPNEIDKGLISILRPLNDDQRKEIRDVLDEYFVRLKEEYLRSWHARQAAKGKESAEPSKQFLQRVDVYLKSAHEDARDKLDQAMKARVLRSTAERRANRFNLLIGFFLGVLASYLATLIWNLVTHW